MFGCNTCCFGEFLTVRLHSRYSSRLNRSVACAYVRERDRIARRRWSEGHIQAERGIELKLVETGQHMGHPQQPKVRLDVLGPLAFEPDFTPIAEIVQVLLAGADCRIGAYPRICLVSRRCGGTVLGMLSRDKMVHTARRTASGPRACYHSPKRIQRGSPCHSTTKPSAASAHP